MCCSVHAQTADELLACGSPVTRWDPLWLTLATDQAGTMGFVDGLYLSREWGSRSHPAALNGVAPCHVLVFTLVPCVYER